MKLIKILLLFVVFQISAQQGGMWIPSLLEGMNEEEMLNLGSNLSANDIYDINNSSLKDAIVHFNGGCPPRSFLTVDYYLPIIIVAMAQFNHILQ